MRAIEQKPKIIRATLVETIRYRVKTYAAEAWRDFVRVNTIAVLLFGGVTTVGGIGIFWLVINSSLFAGLVGSVTLSFVNVILQEWLAAAFEWMAREKRP